MTKPLVVKFIARERPSEWRKYFDNDEHIVNNCKFVFNYENKNYDWLVVYDNIHLYEREELQCNKANTLLLTIEPEVIKKYKKDYTDQFGHILTSHTNEYLDHPNKHLRHQCMKWFYGKDRNPSREYILKGPSYESKSGLISSVYSVRSASKALYKKRDILIKYIHKQINQLDLYVYRNYFLFDKMDCLDKYKYHICIENYRKDHYITEKISDCFLGRCLPFYIGAPNITDYFPKDSFILLDIDDLEYSLNVIKESIVNNEFEKRRDAIEEARKIVIEKENLFYNLADIANNNHKELIKEDDVFIYNYFKFR